MLGTVGAKQTVCRPTKGLVPIDAPPTSDTDASGASVFGADTAKSGAGGWATVVMTVFAHVWGNIPPFLFLLTFGESESVFFDKIRADFPFVLDKWGEVGYNSTAQLYYIGNPN